MAAVLCLVNLTCRDKEQSAEARKDKLREFGFQNYLNNLAGQEEGCLGEQIKTCLRQFREVPLSPLGEDATMAEALEKQ